MLKQRILDIFSKQKSKELALFILVLIEGISPVPVDILLVPLVKKNKHKWKSYLFVTTLGFIISSALFYLLGSFLADKLLVNLLSEYNLTNDFNNSLARFESYGASIIAFLAMAPFPFKISCVAAGSLKIPLYFFLFYSFVGRFLRYFVQIMLVLHFTKISNLYPFRAIMRKEAIPGK